MLLMTKAVTLSYGNQPALCGVDLILEPGQSVAVVGPSGSGKSSLLYCLSGLERPSSGHVVFDGHDVGRMSANERSELRLRSFGFVFQSADLVPELTLRDNIALPLELAGGRRRAIRRRVSELVEAFGLDDCADRRVARVSGGQAQRAAVARAVVASPAVVFADEPTGALDSSNREIVLNTLLEQVSALGALLVMVTHDESAARLVDRVVTLQDGRICRDVATRADDTSAPGVFTDTRR